MNRKPNNNNNNNNRFNFINNELQKEKDKVKDTKDKVKDTKDKVKDTKDNMFKPKETNSRFNLERLMEEPVTNPLPLPLPLPPPPPNPMRNYSFVAASKPQQVQPVTPIQFNNQHSDFPTLSSSSQKNDFPTLSLSSSTKDLKPQVEPAKINFKNALNTTNPVVIEEKKFVLKPGMAYIITDKAGKSKLIYGPKTIEQQRDEYRENSMNYQMYLAISRMEIRWAEERRRYNSIHGENAFQTRYGITSINNSDDDDDTDTNEDDSEYETE